MVETYTVKSVITNTNRASSSSTFTRVMTYKEIRKAIASLTSDMLFTETVHGEGYGWDATHDRWTHFKYAFQWESPLNTRMTYVMFIQPNRETPVDYDYANCD